MAEQVTICAVPAPGYPDASNRQDRAPPEACGMDIGQRAGCRCSRTAALDQDPVGWQVLDWGDTDDKTQTHALVELVVAIGQLAADAAAQVPVTPVLGWIGGVLSAALTDAAVTTLKVLIARLRGQQEQGKLFDFSITKDGQLLLRVDPETSAVPSTVTVRLPDGRHVTVSWNVTAGQLPNKRTGLVFRP